MVAGLFSAHAYAAFWRWFVQGIFVYLAPILS
jgi:hypothetical protein